jgi:aminoglycoside phosphotransferase (APT) family kinase protein
VTAATAIDEDAVRAVARRLLPAADASAIRVLGAGTDHVAVAVDDTFVLRRAAAGDTTADRVERERRLLSLVARVSPVAVPEVVAHDPGSGWTAMRLVPGTSLLDTPADDPRALADELATFLERVHGLPIDAVDELVDADPYPLTAFRADAAEALPAVADAIAPRERPLVERFLAADPPDDATDVRFCHNDLGAEHILAVGGRITGVIDWSDAALTDPARDLGRLRRDLGPDPFARIIDRVAGTDDELRRRAVFHSRCALLEDLAFGLDTGDHRYVRASLAHLRRTFEPTPEAD